MKTYYTTGHDGFWPVGTASVVMAQSEKKARELLDRELEARGLDPKAPVYALEELGPDEAIILRDGDY